MTQLIMKTFDPEAGRPVPVFAVCLAGGRVFVEACREDWADQARAAEERINRDRLQPPARPPAPPTSGGRHD